MPYSRPWTTNRCRWVPVQPKATCNTACRSAIVVSAGDQQAPPDQRTDAAHHHPQLVHARQGCGLHGVGHGAHPHAADGWPRARRLPRFVPLSPPAPASGSLSTSAATGVSDPGGGLVVGPVGIHGVVICGSVRSDRVGCRLDDVCASGGQACRNHFVVPGIAAGCDVRLRAVDFRVGPFPSNRPFIYIRCITACGCPTTQSAEHVDETRIR